MTCPAVQVPDPRRNYAQRFFRWLFAPLVEKWVGLSLTRFIAIGIFALMWDLSHDLLALCAPAPGKAGPGELRVPWGYIVLVLVGLLLSVVTALGAKHVDRLLELAASIANRRFNGVPAPPAAAPARAGVPSDTDLRP